MITSWRIPTQQPSFRPFPCWKPVSEQAAELPDKRWVRPENAEAIFLLGRCRAC